MKNTLTKLLLLAGVFFASSSYAQRINVPGGAPNYKPSVTNPAALPATGNATGDARVSKSNASIYIWDGAAWQGTAGGGAAAWGAIIGTLSNQTDLQTALGLKENTITATTSADYYRGDKTFQPFDAAAQAASISQVITNGVTTKAPSEDAVFDGLALKEPTITATTSADYYRGDKTFQPFNAAAQSAVVTQVITNGVTATAPSEDAVFDGLALKQSTSEKDANNGYAGLDAGGKIAISALPNTVMTFEGQWNANTNTPALADGVGNAGDVWRANVAGTTNFGSGAIAFNLGDWAVYNGTIWEYAANSNLVMSVNGQQGVVVLDTDDIAEGTNLYFTDARAIAAPITGFTSGAGALAATDTILQAINKLDGNIGAATTGNVYGMAGFNASGVLYSIPNSYHTDYNGFYTTIQIPVAGDVTYLNMGSAAGTGLGSVNGILLNNQIESTTNLTLIDLNNSAPVGDDFQGSRLFNTGNVFDGLTMQSVGNSGTFGGQLRLMEANNSGTGAGGILYNISNSGAMSGPFTGLQVSDSGNHTANSQAFNINKTGDTTGDANGIGLNMDGDTTGNVVAFTLGANANLVGGNFMGQNIYSSDVVTGSSTMVSISENGSSTNETGLNISLAGTASTSVVGANIDVSGATFAGQKTALQVQGGIFNSSSSVDTGDYTPGFFFNNNSLGGQLQIDSGSPLLATAGFGNNLGIVVNFDDDVTADNTIGAGNSIGYSINGFVNQITGATGKTFDTINYMFAGGSNPSGDGTIENLNFFRAAGLLNAGGNLTATNLRAFYVDPALDGSVTATNKWGFINASSTSENWFKKNVVVGGTTGLGEAGVELDVDGEARIRSLTTAGYVTTDATGHLTSVAIPGTPVSSNITANTTLSSATRYYFCDTSGGAFTVTLPAAASNDGVAFTVKHTTFGGANDVTVATGQTIDGEAGDTLTAGEGKTYISNGTAWFVSN
jgi:hypothetical protein